MKTIIQMENQNFLECEANMSINERCVEYSYVFKQITEFAPKLVMDMGTGKTAMPSLIKACGIDVVAVDKDEEQIKDNPCTKGGYCSFDIVKENILDMNLENCFDMITCISVLEHNASHLEVVKKMGNMLKVGGVLILTFPFNENEYIPNAYQLPMAGYGRDAGPTNICQMYSKNEVGLWCEEGGMELIDQEYWKAFTGQYWTYGQRMWPPKKVSREETHQLSCITLRKV